MPTPARLANAPIPMDSIATFAWIFVIPWLL
jgi:hypothetical protein